MEDCLGQQLCGALSCEVIGLHHQDGYGLEILGKGAPSKTGTLVVSHKCKLFS